MSKYIIEVEDDAVDGLFKAKGFNTLVFDQNGLDKLQKYEEPIEEVEEEQPWPQCGDTYYFMYGSGLINCTSYNNTTGSDDYVAIGNFFRTREEAEFALERLKVLEEMRKFAEPFGTRWDGETAHYFIYIDDIRDELCFGYNKTTRHDEFYFSSNAKAMECVKAVGKDRIKKYYLGVE